MSSSLSDRASADLAFLEALEQLDETFGEADPAESMPVFAIEATLESCPEVDFELAPDLASPGLNACGE